jgi:hypothetical protein
VAAVYSSYAGLPFPSPCLSAASMLWFVPLVCAVDSSYAVSPASNHWSAAPELLLRVRAVRVLYWRLQATQSQLAHKAQ